MPAALADDDPQPEGEVESELESADSSVWSGGQEKIADGLGDSFEEFAGSPENADNLIRALRKGEQIVLITLDPLDSEAEIETVIENDAGPMGFGSVFTSVALAEELLEKEGLEPTPENIEAVLFGRALEVPGENGPEIEGFDGVLTLRQQGMGWGEIAKTLGFKLGPIISRIRTLRGAQPEEPLQSGLSGKLEKAGKPAKVERLQKPQRPDKPEKLEKPEKPEKPDRPEKPEKPERPGRD